MVIKKGDKRQRRISKKRDETKMQSIRKRTKAIKNTPQKRKKNKKVTQEVIKWGYKGKSQKRRQLLRGQQQTGQ